MRRNKRFLAILIAITMVIAPAIAPTSVYGAEQNPNCPQNHIVGNDTPPDEVTLNDWDMLLNHYFPVGHVTDSSYVAPVNNYWRLFDNQGNDIGPVTRFFFVTGDPNLAGQHGGSIVINRPSGNYAATIIYTTRTTETITARPSGPSTAGSPTQDIILNNVSRLPTAFFSRLNAAQNNAQNGVNMSAADNRANATFFFDEGTWIDWDYLDNNNLSGNNTSIVGLGICADGEPSTTIFKRPLPVTATASANVAGDFYANNGDTGGRMLRWRLNTPNNYIANVILDGLGVNMSPMNGFGSTNSRGSYFIVVSSNEFGSPGGASDLVMRDVIIQNVGGQNTSVNHAFNSGTAIQNITNNLRVASRNQKNVALNVLRSTHRQRNFENLTIRNVMTTGYFAVVQFNQAQNTYFYNLCLAGNELSMHENANTIKIEHNTTAAQITQWLGGNLNNQRDIVFAGTLSLPNRNSMFDGVYLQDYRYRNILLPENFEWALLRNANGGYNQPAIIVFDRKKSPVANINMGAAAVTRYSALQLSTGYWFVEAEPFAHHGSAIGGDLQDQLNHINQVINFIRTNAAVNNTNTTTRVQVPGPNIKMVATSGVTLPAFTVPDFHEPSTIVAQRRTATPASSLYPAYAHSRGSVTQTGGMGIQNDGNDFVQYSGPAAGTTLGGMRLPTNHLGEHRIFNFDFKNPLHLSVGQAEWTIEQGLGDGTAGYIRNFTVPNSGRNLFIRMLPLIEKEVSISTPNDFVTEARYVEVGDTITYRIRVTNPSATDPISAGMVVGDDIHLHLVTWVGNVYINGAPADRVWPPPAPAPGEYSFIAILPFGFTPPPGTTGHLRVTLPEIPAGEYVEVTFQVTANAPAATNPLYVWCDNEDDYVFLFNGVENVAFIVNDDGSREYSNETKVEVRDDDLPTIVKSVHAPVPAEVFPADEVTYMITVTNPSEVTLYDLEVVDEIDLDIFDVTDTELSIVVTGGLGVSYNVDLASGELTVIIDELAAGQSVTITFVVVVRDDAEPQTVVNTANLYLNNEFITDDEAEVEILEETEPNIRKLSSVRLPTLATVGETIEYLIIVRNPGPGTLTNVEIRDTLHSYYYDLGWIRFVGVVNAANHDYDFDDATGLLTVNVGDLAPNTSYTIRFEVEVLNAAALPRITFPFTADPDEVRVIPNRAYLYVEDMPVAHDDQPVSIHPALQPQIQKLVNGVNQITAEPGDMVTYTLRIYNPNHLPNAGIALLNIVVRDVFPTHIEPVNITQVIANTPSGPLTLPVVIGASEMTITFDELPPGPGYTYITFEAIVSANAPVGNHINTAHIDWNNTLVDSDTAIVSIIDETQPQPDPNVSIVKSVVTGNTVAPDGTIVYTLVITNTGNVTLTDLVVTDTLPIELMPGTYILPAGATGGFSGNILSVNLAELAHGASATIVFTATVDSSLVQNGDFITNAAFVEDGVAGVSDDDSETVEVLEPTEPNISIVKAADRSTAVSGDTITYTLLVTNTGNEPLDNLVITDTLPAELANLNVISIVPALSFTDLSTNSVLQIELVDSLGLGEYVIITFEADVVNDLANETDIVNIAQVVGEAYVVGALPITVSDSDTETVQVLAPGVSILKTASPTNPAPGGIVNYTLTITNTGGVPLTSLVVTDTLPGQLINPGNLVVPTGSTNYGFTGQMLSVTLPTLAPGASATITFSATVAAATPRGTSITNTATVTDEDADVSANHSATVTVPTITQPPNGGGGGQPPVVEIPEEDPPLAEMSPYHYAYIIGYPDGYVRPARNITRAEVATIFFRLISDEYRITVWSQSNPFPDVILQNWFNNAISTLTNANLLYGYPDGYFRPNQSMTRAEFAAVIVRIMGERGAMATATNSFSDVSDHWGEAYISVAYELGWVRGYPDGTFRPNQLITRAEVAALVNRALNRLPETPDDLLPGMVIWPDNMNTNAWYYLYMQEATNSHYHEMKANGINETWTELIEPREWWRLERPNSDPRIFTGAYIGEGMGMIEE